MTTEMTTVYEAIKALEANDVEAATNKATAALAIEGIDLTSRVLAAAILMVETLEDIIAIKEMAVYKDMEEFKVDNNTNDLSDSYDGQEPVTQDMEESMVEFENGVITVFVEPASRNNGRCLIELHMEKQDQENEITKSFEALVKKIEKRSDTCESIDKAISIAEKSKDLNVIIGSINLQRARRKNGSSIFNQVDSICYYLTKRGSDKNAKRLTDIEASSMIRSAARHIINGQFREAATITEEIDKRIGAKQKAVWLAVRELKSIIYGDENRTNQVAYKRFIEKMADISL